MTSTQTAATTMTTRMYNKNDINTNNINDNQNDNDASKALGSGLQHQDFKILQLRHIARVRL